MAHWLKFLHETAGWGEEGGVGRGGCRGLLAMRTSSVLNFPLLTRPGIPWRDPRELAAGLGVAWVSWPARGAGGGARGRDGRARGCPQPAGRTEKSARAAVTSPISPDVFPRSLVELNSPQWALWGASSLTSTRV